MNFYQHHIGDYITATAHLSIVEDGAYRRLLDVYYSRERALPASIQDCCKLVRATSKQERDAVAFVLREFFELREDGYHNRRADAEIARYNDKQEKAKRSAEARWSKPDNAQRSHCERISNAMPKHNTSTTNAMRTHCERNANHEPITMNQEPGAIASAMQKSTTPLPPNGDDARALSSPTAAGDLCARLRQKGVQGVNPAHPRLLALIDAGMRPDELLCLADEPRARGKSFAWLLAAAEGRRRDAATVRPLPDRSPQQSLEERNMAVARAWVPPEMRGEKPLVASLD